MEGFYLNHLKQARFLNFMGVNPEIPSCSPLEGYHPVMKKKFQLLSERFQRMPSLQVQALQMIGPALWWHIDLLK